MKTAVVIIISTFGIGVLLLGSWKLLQLCFEYWYAFLSFYITYKSFKIATIRKTNVGGGRSASQTTGGVSRKALP